MSVEPSYNTPVPACECGGDVCQRQTKKPGGNEGRWFFTCRSCSAFCWADGTVPTILKARITQAPTPTYPQTTGGLQPGDMNAAFFRTSQPITILSPASSSNDFETTVMRKLDAIIAAGKAEAERQRILNGWRFSADYSTDEEKPYIDRGNGAPY